MIEECCLKRFAGEVLTESRVTIIKVIFGIGAKAELYKGKAWIIVVALREPGKKMRINACSSVDDQSGIKVFLPSTLLIVDGRLLGIELAVTPG